MRVYPIPRVRIEHFPPLSRCNILYYVIKRRRTLLYCTAAGHRHRQQPHATGRYRAYIIYRTRPATETGQTWSIVQVRARALNGPDVIPVGHRRVTARGRDQWPTVGRRRQRTPHGDRTDSVGVLTHTHTFAACKGSATHNMMCTVVVGSKVHNTNAYRRNPFVFRRNKTILHCCIQVTMYARTTTQSYSHTRSS